jgi:hypothetical protein
MLRYQWQSHCLFRRPDKRAEQRRKDAQEIAAISKDELTTYKWVDEGKGIARIPIERSLELMVQEWKNPQEGRTKLVSRAQKANEVPTYE